MNYHQFLAKKYPYDVQQVGRIILNHLIDESSVSFYQLESMAEDIKLHQSENRVGQKLVRECLDIISKEMPNPTYQQTKVVTDFMLDLAKGFSIDFKSMPDFMAGNQF